MMTKYLDSSTPALIVNAVTEQNPPILTLAYRRAGENPVVYLRLVFTDAMILGITTADEAGTLRPTETVTFKAQSIAVE